MGTRGTVCILDNFLSLVKIYSQNDSYPSGLGTHIKSILNEGNVQIVNGIGAGQKSPAYFNGMGCLAAYLVGQLKSDQIGGFYLTTVDDIQQYNYFLYEVQKSLHIKIADYNSNIIYDGLLSEFDPKKI